MKLNFRKVQTLPEVLIPGTVYYVDDLKTQIIAETESTYIVYDTGTADWNLEENKIGGIKNRTHYYNPDGTVGKQLDAEFISDEYTNTIKHWVEKESEIKTSLSDEISRATAAENAIKNQIDDLYDVTEEDPGDSGKSIRTIAYEEVSKIVDSAPESFDTLKEIADYIESDETHAGNIAYQLGNHEDRISDLETGKVIIKGEADNSVVLKDLNNKAISEGSVALGSNNLVGLKGFYYKHIRFVSDTIANVYLSRTQVIPTITIGSEIKDTTIIPSDYYSKGDVISIINDNKYDNIAVINNMSEGMIQIKWNSESPFTAIKKETDLSPEDYTIYSLDKPDKGLADIGKYSFTTGTDNKAINSYTEVSGKDNTARSKFAKVWGKNNIGGYNTTTFGTNNTNLADNSLVNGTNNINEGSNSVIHGNKNKNYGKRAFIVGNENIANNENESAFGKYNNSENDTHFSIGIGTSDTVRKNAFEVKANGDIYIEGVDGRIQDKLNVSPDWNVQEGESGYIKNKPFYFNNTVDIRFSYNDENDTILASEGLRDNTHAFFRICTNITYVEDNGDEPIYVYHKVESGNSYRFIDEHNDIEYNVYVSDIENTLNITTESIPKDIICKYVGLVLSHNVKQIDGIYLPDTVVKTTFQTLSETDKNQALTNLGIDPVVWKYMCNPYEIMLINGTDEIPEDLAESISKNLNYARLTVSLCINGDVYFANGIGNSQFLMFNIPDSNPIYIGFNGKNVITP